jgi:hypothetical protein
LALLGGIPQPSCPAAPPEPAARPRWWPTPPAGLAKPQRSGNEEALEASRAAAQSALALQSSAGKALRAELSITQAQLKETESELVQVKGALA